MLSKVPAFITLLGAASALKTASSTASNQTFDFVIVGGGTAGLVLANRLSANSNITVAVIEAGAAEYDNPNVTSVESFGLGLDTPLNWAYTSAPQRFTENRTIEYDAGKGLGGSTLINGMTHLRAEKAQIDVWAQLGNEGWDWETLWPFYLKYEQFHTPTDLQAEEGAIYETADHGVDGPVTVGWSEYFMGMDMFGMLSQTSENIGIPLNRDANGGFMQGFSTWPFTLNSTDNIRADAARSYYYPVAASRPNLHVYLNSTATNLVWDSVTLSTSAVRAKGVNFVDQSGSSYILSASREVILSAGAIRSPALLELSGVGNPSILSSLNITSVVNLPGVGGNMQDQPNVLMDYLSPTNWTGYPSFVTYLTANVLFGPNFPVIAKTVQANLSAYAQAIAADSPDGGNVTAIERILSLQAQVMFAENTTTSIAELLWAPGSGFIAGTFWTTMPFSRGSIHIASTDPLTPPTINTNFFELPIDEYVQAAIGVALRRYVSTAPLSNNATTELSPNTTIVPSGADYADPAWAAWLKGAYGSNSHPIGTCAMMDKDLGGAVDNQGKVYGTSNVRVVDASIIPMQVSGHLSATVYAIAEKIAETLVSEL